MSDEINEDATFLAPDEGDARAEAIQESMIDDGTAALPPVPEALSEVDPARLDELRAKLAAFIKPSSEAEPDGEPTEGGPIPPEKQGPQGPPMARDVDWDEYDLEFGLRHLYPRSTLRPISDGSVHWVVMLDEFYTTNRSGKNHGKLVHDHRDTQNPDSKTDPLNLGEYLTAMVNGPEGWKIAALLPAGTETTVVLQRQTPFVLPDPKPLNKLKEEEGEVALPSDVELKRTEEAALAFAAEQGLAPPPIEDGTEEVFEPIGKMHVQPLPPEKEGATVRDAIALNDEITIGAPQGEQPDSVVLDDPQAAALGLGQRTREGVEIAAGIQNIREGLGNILSGPDFERTVE